MVTASLLRAPSRRTSCNGSFRSGLFRVMILLSVTAMFSSCWWLISGDLFTDWLHCFLLKSYSRNNHPSRPRHKRLLPHRLFINSIKSERHPPEGSKTRKRPKGRLPHYWAIPRRSKISSYGRNENKSSKPAEADRKSILDQSTKTLPCPRRVRYDSGKLLLTPLSICWCCIYD